MGARALLKSQKVAKNNGACCCACAFILIADIKSVSESLGIKQPLLTASDVMRCLLALSVVLLGVAQVTGMCVCVCM